MTPLPERAPQVLHPAIDRACAVYIRASVKSEALRGVSDLGMTSAYRDLAKGDEAAVVIAGVRAGVYTLERVGKRPVVMPPREQDSLV